MNNLTVPNCIINLFVGRTGYLPIKKSDKKTEGEYIFLGAFRQGVFDMLPWHSKTLDDDHLPEDPDCRYAYIRTSEAVLYALGESQEDEGLLSEIQKLEVLEYAERAGIEIPQSFFETKSSPPPERVEKKKTTPKKTKQEKILPPAKKQDDKIDFFRGKVKDVVEINLEKSTEIKTPSGSKSLVLLPGKHLFALIDSPLEHEKERGVQWLVLQDQLPVVYGRSVPAWQTILENDPLSL